MPGDTRPTVEAVWNMLRTVRLELHRLNHMTVNLRGRAADDGGLVMKGWCWNCSGTFQVEGEQEYIMERVADMPECRDFIAVERK